MKRTCKYEIYDKKKTSYNINLEHIIKLAIFATFQQPYSGLRNACLTL